MRLSLKDHDVRDDRFAKIAFTGHRGSGKSTELLRLEHDLGDDFTSLHLYADEALIDDYDYTDLLLWLVDALVREFEKAGTPLDPRLADDVALWFAEVTLKQTEQVKSEIQLETEAKAEAKASLFWLSLGLLGRLKSMVAGSAERRKEIRRELQNKSSELISRVNLLLDHAHTVLGERKKRANLLIVVDNLDRLPPEVSTPLFFENGGLLKQLRAHFIFTVPIPTALAGMNIGLIFETYTLSMVKVRTVKGGISRKGLDALVKVIAQRVEITAVFVKEQVVRDLAKMSGGSVRDLMRLVRSAQLIARTDDKKRIDTDAAKRAILKMRLEFERLLIPPWIYYPLLAKIHQSKAPGATGPEEEADPERVKRYIDFLNHLLFNGSVLEYNGIQMWYDVHPVIQEIAAFKKALANAQSAPKPEQGAD
jgi:hypothetical protein